MVLVLPCIKGQMGNTSFYQGTMKVRDLVQGVRAASELDEWTTMTIEDRLQREPDIKRIQEEIAPYIAASKDRFFGAMIVLVYKGEVEFESVKELLIPKAPRAYKTVADSMGTLTIDGSTLIMLDGQHRLLALEKVIKGDVPGDCRESVPIDDVCVIFLSHESNEKTRRIFNKVNRYAKPTSRGDNIITSEDDRSAIIARKLLSEGAPLGIKVKGSNEVIVEWKNHTLPAKSEKLTTISAVYETVKLILASQDVPLDPTSRPSEDELELYYDHVESFWNEVLDGLQAYKDALDDSTLIPHMRKDDQPYSLLFKSVPQIALFKGLITSTRDNRLTLKEAVKRANNIDWSISSPIWKNVLVTPNGRMATSKISQNLGSKFITYLIAADKMTEQEIAQIKREYNNAHGININDAEANLIELPQPVVKAVCA